MAIRIRQGWRKFAAFGVTLVALVALGLITGAAEPVAYAIAGAFAAFCGANVGAKFAGPRSAAPVELP